MARDYQGDAVCSCGKDVPVYLTGGGMLTASCGWCRLQTHCGAGSASFRKMQASLKKGLSPDLEQPAATPAPAQKTAKTATPAATITPAATEKTIFDIFK